MNLIMFLFLYNTDLLRNENASWSERQSAVFVLEKLFNYSYQNCIDFLDAHGHVSDYFDYNVISIYIAGNYKKRMIFLHLY